MLNLGSSALGIAQSIIWCTEPDAKIVIQGVVNPRCEATLPLVVGNTNGSETLFDLYAATIIWDGQYRDIDVAESETESLIGMALLYGYRVQIDTIEGGIVRIEALSS